jgi:hypothetical protein
MNPYTYSHNNPATVTDPSGELVVEIVALGLFALALYDELSNIAEQAQTTYGQGLLSK